MIVPGPIVPPDTDPHGVTDLERIFASISRGIDEAGQDRAPLFLARLSLLLATELGDPECVLKLIADARLSSTDGLGTVT